MTIIGMLVVGLWAVIMVVITDTRSNKEYKKNNPDWELEKISLKQQIKDTLGG